MRIRRLAVLTTTLVVVLSPAAPAHAAVRVSSTSLGEVEQRSPIPVVVELENRVERGDPREPERVVLRLDDGPDKGVPLPCVWDTTERFERRAVCEADDVAFDPRTGAPFAGAPLANGDHELTVDLGEGRQETVEVVQSVRGSAVTDLTTRVDGADVTLSWTRAPEPDVAGYRVQRRSGGDWTTVTTTAGDASGATDRDRAAGDHQYRVLTVRPDGRGGDPFVTASSVGEATVARPTPSSSSTGAGSPGPGGPDGAGDSGEGSSGDGGRAGAPSLGTSSQSGDDAVSVAEPPSPDTAGSGERFYGEDDGFSEELDFGDAPAVAGEEDAEARTDLVRIPGGRGVLSARLERLLPPLAGGLVLVALGLHLRQWLVRGSGYLRLR